MTNLTCENKIVRFHKIVSNATGVLAIFNLIFFLCAYYIGIGYQQIRMFFFVLATVLLFLQVAGLLAVLSFKAIALKQKHSASATGDKARDSWLDLLSPKSFFWVALQMFMLMWTWILYSNISRVALGKNSAWPPSFSENFSLVYVWLNVLIVCLAIVLLARSSFVEYKKTLECVPEGNGDVLLAKRNMQANILLLAGYLCIALCGFLTFSVWFRFIYLSLIALGILAVTIVMKWRIAKARGKTRLRELLPVILGFLLLTIPVVLYFSSF